VLLLLLSQVFVASATDRDGLTVRAEAGVAHSEAYVPGTYLAGSSSTTGLRAFEFALAAGWRKGSGAEIFGEIIDRQLRPSHRVLAGQAVKDSVTIDGLALGLGFHSDEGVSVAIGIGGAIVRSFSHAFDGFNASSIKLYSQVFGGALLRFTLAKEWPVTPNLGLGLAAHFTANSDAHTWAEYAGTLAVRASFF
jgi:hypothetical protein